MINKLIQFKDIEVSLLADKQNGLDVPRKIVIENQGNPILQINFDAVDGMVFSTIDDLKQPDEKQQYILLSYLAKILHQYSGGKCLFTVSHDYIPLVIKYLKLNPYPKIPRKESAKYQYFSNLMFRRSDNERWHKKLYDYKDKWISLSQQYLIIQDNSNLEKQSDAISDLFKHHAPWVESTPENKRVYTSLAIKHRLKNNSLSSYAAINKTNGNIDGFVRVYSYHHFHYLSDLVVRTEKRQQGLATYLLNQAFPKQGVVVLIAGDANLVNMYSKFGFTKLSEQAPLLIGNQTLMCGIFPFQAILENYMQSLGQNKYA